MRNRHAHDSELLQLREKCQVLMNLVRDVLENEACANNLSISMDEEVINRVLKTQFEQRRALCAEMSIFVVRENQSGYSSVR